MGVSVITDDDGANSRADKFDDNDDASARCLLQVGGAIALSSSSADYSTTT